VGSRKPTLHCQACILLKQGDCTSLALQAAEIAVQLAPATWRFWVTLAKAFLQAGRYEECLACINSSVFGNATEAASSNDCGLPDLSAAQQTRPRKGVSHSRLTALRPVAYAMLQLPQASAGARVTTFGGFGLGFGLNPGLDDRMPLPGSSKDDASDDAVANARGFGLLLPERAAYAVLVAMYRQLGWDGLLTVRSKVFLMQDEDVPDDCTGESDSHAVLHPRLCTRFLDSLFETLHADLHLFTEWAKEESLGIPHRGSGEHWMHRGALAERLQQDVKAEAAFRLCQARGICLRASCRLLRIYVRRDRQTEAVAQLAVLCGAASGVPPFGKTTVRTWQANDGWPDWLFELAALVVCKFGFTDVQAAFVPERFPEQCHAYRAELADLLHAVRVAGVDGCER